MTKQLEITGETVFDFSIDTELMDETTKTLYYLLRHRAAKRRDDSLLPDGKKMTQAEVEEAIGQTVEETQITKKCCGG